MDGFGFEFRITSIQYVPDDEPGEPVTVSEPGTLALPAFGLVGLGLVHRRRERLDA